MALTFRTALAGLLLALALGAGGCRGVTVKGGEVTKMGTRYRFGDPGEGWRPVRLSDNDVAWVEDRTGHALSANATCESYQDVPLEALTRQLLVGFTESERLDQSREPLDGRESLRSHYRAKLDGVPVELGLVVGKKDGCIYDFTYTAPPDRYGAELPSFERLVNGFATEPHT